MPPSRSSRAAAALGLAAALLAPSLAAQARVGAAIDVTASRVTFDDFLPSRAWTVAPYLRGGWGLLDVAGHGAFTRFESGNSAATLGAGASLRTAEWRGWQAELGGALSRLEYELSPRILTADATGRLHRAVGPATVGLGFTLGLTDDTATVRNVRTGDLTLLGRALGTTLSLQVAGRRIGASLVEAERSPSGLPEYTPPLEWGESRLDARWEGGARWRTQLDLSAGMRFGRATRERIPGVRQWAQGTATVRLLPGIAAVAALGREPHDPVRSAPGGPFGMLGLRWATGGSGAIPVARPRVAERLPVGAPIATPLTGQLGARHGRTSSTLRIWAPSARKVELMADFTDWEPVLMARVGDWWLVTVPRIGAGPHRVNVRIDGGAWGVPAGVPVLRDDFDGVSGVLVVDED